MGKETSKHLKSQNNPYYVLARNAHQLLLVSKSNHQPGPMHCPVNVLTSHLPCLYQQPAMVTDTSPSILRESFAYSTIMKELNIVKREVSILKSTSSSTRCSPSDPELRNEIARLRSEFQSLKATISQDSSATDHLSFPTQHDPQTSSELKIVAWNCRGLSKAIPLTQDVATNHDVIILTEHWLWPYDLGNLEDIHPEFTGLGCSDNS